MLSRTDIEHWCVDSHGSILDSFQGAVLKIAWSPDGCALALSWLKGGLSVWSVFGACLFCTFASDRAYACDGTPNIQGVFHSMVRCIPSRLVSGSKAVRFSVLSCISIVLPCLESRRLWNSAYGDSRTSKSWARLLPKGRFCQFSWFSQDIYCISSIRALNHCNDVRSGLLRFWMRLPYFLSVICNMMITVWRRQVCTHVPETFVVA